MEKNYTQNDFMQNIPFMEMLVEQIKQRDLIDSNIVNTFIKPGCALALLETELTIIIANSEITKQITLSNHDVIEQLIQELTHTKTQLSIMDKKEYEQYLSTNIVIDPTKSSQTTQTTSSFGIENKLMSSYTFDNFVIGDCNKECHAAALACAYNPGKFYNPLFIYGNSGIGKTHLLCAVGNYVLANHPNSKVCYMPTMDFVEYVTSSIHKGTIDAFKHELKTYDVLLMDDIQFLANKEKSHEIFFNCYNELINNNKQIIVVSDRLPSEIKGLEQRIISRFDQGLTVGMDSPEFETSLAILKRKLSDSSEFENDIDEESLVFLASHFSRDVRQLEGALKRLQFKIIQYHPQTPVDLAFTVKAFDKSISEQTLAGNINPRKIITTVADYYNLTRQQIISKTRTKHVSMARQICMYLIRKKLDLPYLAIGAEFGGKDHSTVMNSINKIEKLRKTDKSYELALKELEKLLEH